MPLRSVLLVLFGLASTRAAAPGEIDLIWGVKTPMRDGVEPNATVFRPRPQDAPLP